jgi:hypothetical protein
MVFGQNLQSKTTLPQLVDYTLSILGSSSDALCETVITMEPATEFKTRGLDSDKL